MNVRLDADVQLVAEFMQSHVPAAKLRSVSAALSDLAPIMWGHYNAETIIPLLLSPSNLDHALHTLQDAT